jgi:hypothetical protein
VTAAVEDFPSLVAVIVTNPTATPVTRPDVETVATAGSDDVQVTALSVRVLELKSRIVAVSCVVLAIATVSEAGVIHTVLTGGGIVIVAVPDLLVVPVVLPGAV